MTVDDYFYWIVLKVYLPGWLMPLNYQRGERMTPAHSSLLLWLRIAAEQLLGEHWALREREARQAGCVENHCEIHAPLNPEWPLVKCARVGAEEERKEIGGGITHPTPDTLLQMRRESQDLNDYKLSTECLSHCGMVLRCCHRWPSCSDVWGGD